jgi:hypothetical protein
MKSGTRVLKKVVTTSNVGVSGYQHRYSLIQHILWRLDNEVNGNDLPLVYGLTAVDIIAKKLNTYTGIRDGIIWPTPHFKYEFDVATTTDFTSAEVIDLILKKLKQYKPKHTVADLTIGYPIESTDYQVDIVASNENFETEIMTSDMGGDTITFPAYTTTAAYTYTIPIVTTDAPALMTDPVYYGEAVDFTYVWTGHPDVHYEPFTSYPQGISTDVDRNRQRYFNYTN